MSVRTTRGWVAVAFLALLAAGCSDAVTGSAESDDDGTVAGPDADHWVHSPALEVLAVVPARPSTQHRISLVDVATLNRVAQRTGYPSGAPEAGQRPASETAWLDALAVDDQCGDTLDGDPDLRSGTGGDALTVLVVTDDADGELAACVGAADPGRLKDAELRRDEPAPQALGGIDGVSSGGEWIGVDGDLTYVVADDVPPQLAASVISGGDAADGSLADSTMITTMLDAAPGAAMIEVGSDLVGVDSYNAPEAVRIAFSQAVAQGGYGRAPVPNFGGYAWVPQSRTVGTAVFVTDYGSTQEAETVAAILTDVWQRLGDSKFTGATTERRDTQVVTTVDDVVPRDFVVSDGVLGDYPAFLGRE